MFTNKISKLSLYKGAGLLLVKNNIFDKIFNVGEDGILEFKNYLAGHWVAGEEFYDIKSPIDQSIGSSSW